MNSFKQNYFPHDINRRFRFLSIVSLFFLAAAVTALIISAIKLAIVISAINLFAVASAIISYNTARSLRPQMSAYYFPVGFLVFSMANTSFWLTVFLRNNFSHGIFLLLLLLVLNMIINYSVTYKAYQIWINAGLSLLALLFYNIFEIEHLKFRNLSNVVMINLVPVIFIVVLATLLSYMYEIRTGINKYYKGKFKNEKRHLMKIISNIDRGYASFRVKYNDIKQPVNAKIEHYNQTFLDVLEVSHTSIDEARICDINSNGNPVFPDYLELLNDFERRKSFYFDIQHNGELIKVYVFPIENKHMGMILKKG